MTEHFSPLIEKKGRFSNPILESITTLKCDILQHVRYLHHYQSVNLQDNILQELQLYTIHWKHLQIANELCENFVSKCTG